MNSPQSQAQRPTPWTMSYPPGMHWDAELPLMPVAQFLDDAVARWPDRPCIEFMGRVISYRELGELSDRAAQGFQALGVGPGVHVGLYLPNTPHYPIAFFGVLKAGGVVVNYSPLDAERVLAHKVEDSRTDILVTLDLTVLYPQMARILGHSRLQKLVVGSLPEFSAAPEPVRAHLQGAGLLAPVASDDKHLSFAQLLDNDGRHVTRHPVGDLKEEVVVLQYTGGTTGLPKGAMLTHANLAAASAQYLESTKGNPPILDEGVERFLVVLPLFHIYALSAAMLLGMRLGASLVLHTKFDVDAVFNEIAGSRITVFPGVPTMYMGMLAHPKASTTDLRSLKFCGSGGAPLPVEVEQRFFALTGCHLNEGWGMTETSPSGTFTPARGKRKAGSCGMPLPGIHIKLLALDGSGNEVAPGEPGELCVTGPNVMKGYWNNPQATADAMTPDGYFKSGDVARFDDEGFLYIVDRTKDMLLCGGFNVYPRVLEEAIYEHPSVAEACVIGVPDEYRGQSPKAFVVQKPGSAPLDLETLKAFLKDRLGKHEMISELEVRDQLPKTAVGKLSKKDLVEEEARKRAAN
ncbi:MAG: long-chain fatty acid--CoA ligase [Gammaproteobacteria bacterium]|nr:long-chain fatty acid--CoA ligase [Gammaproteobacteria bacterium]MBU1442504.1 long-chain fatty acid--CoA ligase [Gammaproteobacteria bacterium]